MEDDLPSVPGRVSKEGRVDWRVAASFEYSTSLDSMSVSRRRASLRIASQEAVIFRLGTVGLEGVGLCFCCVEEELGKVRTDGDDEGWGRHHCCRGAIDVQADTCPLFGEP